MIWFFTAFMTGILVCSDDVKIITRLILFFIFVGCLFKIYIGLNL